MKKKWTPPLICGYYYSYKLLLLLNKMLSAGVRENKKLDFSVLVTEIWINDSAILFELPVEWRHCINTKTSDSIFDHFLKAYLYLLPQIPDLKERKKNYYSAEEAMFEALTAHLIS